MQLIGFWFIYATSIGFCLSAITIVVLSIFGVDLSKESEIGIWIFISITVPFFQSKYDKKKKQQITKYD